MSVPEIQPSLPPPSRPQALGGCMVALLIVIGVVLVLPGLCSLILMIAVLPQGGSPGSIVGLWLLTFAIAAAGIWLIRYAIKNR
jgi:hypothetical protein